MSDTDDHVQLARLFWPEQLPQRQDSLRDQLEDLHVLAARYGMYDAADWLWKRMHDAGE